MLFKTAGSAEEEGAKSKLPLRNLTVRRKKSVKPITAVPENGPLQEARAEGPQPLSTQFEAPAHDVPASELQQSSNGPALTHKASKRKTMLDFFKGKKEKEQPKPALGAEVPELNFPKRMGTRKYRASKQSDRRSSSPPPVKDDVLDRIMGAPKGMPRQMSDQFLLKQRIRANSRAASQTHMSPSSARSQAQYDREPLSAETITEMFTGAPYFNVERKKNSFTPQVIFRGDNVLEAARYGTDHGDLAHSSFIASTLGIHGTKEIEDRPPSRRHEVISQLFSTSARDPLLEVPSMLSANGTDRGTVGFEHFLQLPVADSMILPEEPEVFEQRALLTSNPESLGLRELDIEQLINRLTELGELYATLASSTNAANLLNEEKMSEMGEDLFGRLLSSDLGTTPAGTGSVSLRTQIDALQKVLGAKDIWHDFSLVEWRIRAGQLLWASIDMSEGSELEAEPQPSERDVLLLQVTLAAELLVRLKLIRSAPASGSTFPPIISEMDREEIEESRSKKVDWDLLLAERFLDNLTIAATLPDQGESGNRSSFLSAMSFFSAREDPADLTVRPLLFPKNEKKQIEGLLVFADALDWPHTEDVKSQLESQPEHTNKIRPVSTVSEYATPLSSPRMFGSPGTPGNRLSYFGDFTKLQQQMRPGLSRMTTAQSMQLLPASTSGSDGFQVGGWLSRSWLAGLVLPGEAASHFLISTLLENSTQAIDALGDCANLYGGFLYQGRSFWSKSCVVGRVLAATAHSRECMSWISVPGSGAGQPTLPDGWINVNVKDFPYSLKEPKIKESESVAKDSDPLHGNRAVEVQAGDFTVPVDGPPVMGNEALSHGLSFISSGPTFEPTSDSDDGLSASSASTAHLTFSSPINPKLAHLNVPLTYDVHFISSYPCYPAPLSKRNSPPTSPSADKLPTSPSSALSFEKELPPPPAHPLHIDYRFSVIPVAALLSATPPASRSRGLSVPGQSPKGAASDDEEVVVLDSRGSADLELLARAWCAKVGENAVIGKEGRTCLACCVREARALGVTVIIRT